MGKKVYFQETMSHDYIVSPTQHFTKKEAVFITKAINEALRKERIYKEEVK